MKLLEIGKDMKIKHSVYSPPSKYEGTFFLKKLCMGEQTFLDKFMGGCFTCELIIRSYMIIGGGKVSQMHFRVI